MEEVAQRIKELIDKEGLSNTEFAKKIDVNPSIISHILSGRNKPSLQLIDAIKTYFTNVNLDYLISGKGSIFNDFTNVKDNEIPSSESLQTNMAFPMEGIRHAAIPGSAPAPKDPPGEKAEVPPEEKPLPPSSSNEAPARPGVENSSGRQIEQIVIFYTDGSFKAYRP